MNDASRLRLAPLLILPLLAAGPLPRAGAQAEAGSYVLIREGLETQSIRLLEISETRMAYLDVKGGVREIALDRCVGIFDPGAVLPDWAGGTLRLTDGQLLPGEAISNARPEDDTLAWNHVWLGRLDVPLDRIRFLRLVPWPVALTPGDGDRLLLANGDRLDGLVVSLGDPISLEVSDESGPRVIDVPLQRVAALTMITPPREPAGRRVWFRDGSLLDVRSVRVGDDGFVRLEGDWFVDKSGLDSVPLDRIAAVLFHSDVMVPLASLAPSRIDGAEGRYFVPTPTVTTDGAPLGLSGIEFRGPLIARYATPKGATRFAAEARLPLAAHEWGDFELIVYDDDRVVFSTPLNREFPSATINVPLDGSELTIELTPGRFGPIQDRLVLEGAMVAVGDGTR